MVWLSLTAKDEFLIVFQTWTRLMDNRHGNSKVHPSDEEQGPGPPSASKFVCFGNLYNIYICSYGNITAFEQF